MSGSPNSSTTRRRALKFSPPRTFSVTSWMKEIALNSPESLGKRFFSLHSLSGWSEDADVAILMACARIEAVLSNSEGVPRGDCASVDPPRKSWGDTGFGDPPRKFVDSLAGLGGPKYLE